MGSSSHLATPSKLSQLLANLIGHLHGSRLSDGIHVLIWNTHLLCYNHARTDKIDIFYPDSQLSGWLKTADNSIRFFEWRVPGENRLSSSIRWENFSTRYLELEHLPWSSMAREVLHQHRRRYSSKTSQWHKCDIDNSPPRPEVNQETHLLILY